MSQHQPIASFVGVDPDLMFMARLLIDVYGEDAAIEALREHLGLSSDTTTLILQQLHANDN